MIELGSNLTIIVCSMLLFNYWVRYAFLLITMTTEADVEYLEASLDEDCALFHEAWVVVSGSD